MTVTLSSWRIFALLLNCWMFTVRPAVAFSRSVRSLPQRIHTFSTLRLFATAPLSNKDLVERRIEKSRAKRLARDRSVQERVERNYNIKRILHGSDEASNEENGGTEFSVGPLYAVKVWVDEALREELRLTGREKRGRVFIEAGSQGASTLRGLKDELFSFFRALRKDTFLLTATLPQVIDEGTMMAVENPVDSWNIASDEDVVKTFELANAYFEQQNAALKRPSIQINVIKDPNAPPPPPPPAYLEGMEDPAATTTMTMLSFYAFPPQGVEDPEEFAFVLGKKWKPFQALGRVYVAKEGVNAQMSVPTNVLENFMECCRSIPELGEYMENDINIDPKPLTLEEFASAGVPINGKPAAPFRNLHVRVRTQVVADGLDKPLDWQSAGYDCPPLEWHQKLKEARELRESGREDQAPILLDCRNNYETDIGIFDGAEPLNTESFRESWEVLKDRLADIPKDAPIMTYCTGYV
jgi:predicted sulfurtransferase